MGCPDWSNELTGYCDGGTNDRTIVAFVDVLYLEIEPGQNDEGPTGSRREESKARLRCIFHSSGVNDARQLASMRSGRGAWCEGKS